MIGQGSCTGTLIAPAVVLTAGHCEAAQMTEVIANTTDYNGAGGVRSTIKRITAYPNWETSYDVAVLVLNTPITGVTPRKIGTACTFTEGFADSTMVHLVGFGLTDTAGMGEERAATRCTGDPFIALRSWRTSRRYATPSSTSASRHYPKQVLGAVFAGGEHAAPAPPPRRTARTTASYGVRAPPARSSSVYSKLGSYPGFVATPIRCGTFGGWTRADDPPRRYASTTSQIGDDPPGDEPTPQRATLYERAG